MDRISELLDGLIDTPGGQTAAGILNDHAQRSQAYGDFRARYPTPSDFAAWTAQRIAPNIAGLLSGQPAPPMENFPAEPGKIPEVGTNLLAQRALGEAADIGVGLVGPPMKAAALPIAAGIARLAPTLREGATLANRGARAPGFWAGASHFPLQELQPAEFHGAIAAAKEAHPSGAAVTLYSPEEYAGMRTWTAPDKSAGFALNGDDIVSVYKHPESTIPNAAQGMLSEAVRQGGRRLDAFDTTLPYIYGKSGFRAVARIPFDPEFAPPGWSTEAFKKYNGGKPDVVFMVHDPYNPGYTAGQGVKVGSYDEAVAIQKREADRVSQRLQAGQENFDKAASQVTGLKGIAEYLTPQELELVTKRNGDTLVEMFRSMPKAEEMASVAFSGRAKRGWYRDSANAIVDTFGAADADRFVGLLAAMSPRVSVESNTINALRTWNEWVKAGRPADKEGIYDAMARGVLGDKGLDSVMPGWRNNAVRVLSAADPRSVQISGPKVNSFSANLRNQVHEVTNDAWMANYTNIDQILLRGVGKDVLGKGAGYMGMSASVRRAAKVLSEKTGEVWTPAEVQETIWSWAKTLSEKAASGGKDVTAQKLLKAADLTHAEIGATPDFALLFQQGIYRKILEEGGYGKQLESLAARSAGKGSRGAAGTPLLAEGSGIAQPAFEGYLQRAARRLDERAKQRAKQGTAVEE